MRPACHLDTQNTISWQFGHPKVYVRICWRWLFLEDRRCRSCSVTFIRHTKQYLALKSKMCKGMGSILLVVCSLYHTLYTQKSMKPLFGHPVSKYRLRPCMGGGDGTPTISDPPPPNDFFFHVNPQYFHLDPLPPWFFNKWAFHLPPPPPPPPCTFKWNSPTLFMAGDEIMIALACNTGSIWHA